MWLTVQSTIFVKKKDHFYPQKTVVDFRNQLKFELD